MKKKQAPADLPHLGGHNFTTHIDTAILNFFKQDLNCKTMLDIGCGPGGMVYEADSLGYSVIGIDGDYRLERSKPKLFILHDFTKGPCPLNKTFDLGYSCEFVEHVHEEYLDNFVDAFLKCNYIAMTFAPPGTKGHHHVNCRTQDYWIDQLELRGLKFDQELTDILRNISSMERDFFRDNGLCFKNESICNKSA